MKKFDETFAQAVSLLLTEETRKSAREKIVWSPGKGSWSGVIKGLAAEADVPYDKVIAASSAATAARPLMIRLGVNKASTSEKGPEAAAQILQQAFKNTVLAEMYEPPRGTANSVNVKFKIETDSESVKTGEGISARNATVYIHLTLIGAYNAGFLKLTDKIVLRHSDSGVVITAN